MKLSIITPCGFPSFKLGGPVKSTLDLATQIKTIDNSVILNIISWRHEYKNNLYFSYKKIGFLKLNGLKIRKRYLFIGLVSLIRLVKYIYKSEIIILNLGFDPLITISGFISILFSKKILFLPRGNHVKKRFLYKSFCLKRFFLLLDNFWMSKSTIIYLSERELNSSIKTKSKKYEILFPISKSIDTSQNKVKEKAVIFCHRFKDVSEKGYDYLCKLSNHLKTLNYEIKVCGEGDFLASKEQTYLGVLSHEDLEKLLINSEAFFLFSKRGEGTSQSFLTAIRCGCKILCNDLACPKELEKSFLKSYSYLTGNFQEDLKIISKILLEDANNIFLNKDIDYLNKESIQSLKKLITL